MTLLDHLQHRFGRFAVPHVTEGLIGLQMLAYLLQLTSPGFVSQMELVPARLLQGEIWRLFTFLFTPPLGHPIIVLFFWYMFYLMGAALENVWGAFRYNVYLLVGWLATIAASLLQPEQPASAAFLQGSVFLAFAHIYPDFQLWLFLILPVKMRWLALFQWCFYLFILLFGSFIERLMVAASVLNFFLFFGRDIFVRMKSGRRRMAQQAERIGCKDSPRHTCAVCGVTNLSDPAMTFRYCSKCAGSPCYCEKHLQAHSHVARRQDVQETAGQCR